MYKNNSKKKKKSIKINKSSSFYSKYPKIQS